MTIFSANNRWKKHLKEETMKKSVLNSTIKIQNYCNGSQIATNRRFIHIDNNGTLRTIFFEKDKKSFRFKRFGVPLYKFIHQQLKKPMIFHDFEIQKFKNNLCRAYSLYFLSSRKNGLL